MVVARYRVISFGHNKGSWMKSIGEKPTNWQLYTSGYGAGKEAFVEHHPFIATSGAKKAQKLTAQNKTPIPFARMNVYIYIYMYV